MKKILAVINGSVPVKDMLFGLIFLTFAHSGYGQSGCNQRTIANAQEKFDVGKLEEVDGILIPCLPYFKSDDEKFLACKLLANTYVAYDSFVVAREYVKAMIRYNPGYEANEAQETQALIQLVKEVEKANETEAIADILVTTASKRLQYSSDAPATIYVRTREQIVKRGYRNLIDLLEDIPEIEIQKNSISEFKNQVVFRGIAGNEKFIIMLDGVRITPTTGDPYTLGTNYSLVNAKSVEVILGPASALYGVDAFSGIINIITLGKELKGVTINSNYGQYNTTDNSLLAGAYNEDVGFNIAAQYYSSQEPDFYSIYENEFSWYNEKYLPDGLMDVNGQEKQISTSPADRKFEMPTSSYFISSKLNFGNFEIGASRNSERHSSSINVDPRYTLYTREALISTTLQSVYAKHIFSRERWSLQSYLMSSNFVMDPDTKFINRYTEYGKGYKYQFGNSKKIEEQVEYNINKNTSLIGGASIENLNALPKTADLPLAYNNRIPAADQDVYYLNTDTVDGTGRSLKILQDFHYLNYQHYGVFFQFYSKRIKYTELTLGGRFDYNTRFGKVFNPRFGAVIKPMEKIKIKLLYGQSFLAPCPWKAYSTFGSFSVISSGNAVTGLESPFFHIPNNDLKPERLASAESSVIIFPNKNLVLSMDGYYTKINDLINIQSPQGQGIFKEVNVIYTEKAINQGLAHTYGGTVHASYSHELGRSRINVVASYSYADGRIDEKPLILTAKNTLKSAIDWSYNKVSVSLRVIRRSKSNSAILDSQQNYITNNAFSVLNFFGRYELIRNDRFELVLSTRIDNLTNARYYNVAAGQDSFSATPQDPIRASIGLQLTMKKQP